MDDRTASQTELPGSAVVGRRPLPYLAAGGAFVAVEIGAEVVRRRLIGAPGGPLSNPVAALAAVTIWTYLAHTRYAFRASARTGLSTLPRYFVLCLALAVTASIVGAGASGPGDVAVFAAVTTLKFAILRMGLWPPGRDRHTRAAQA